jgi:hypothetical protein
MRIIAIDPGPTTGICIYDHFEMSDRSNAFLVKPGYDKREFMFDQVNVNSAAQYLWFWEQLNFWCNNPDTHVVLERFNFRKDERDRTKIIYTPAEIVGIVRLWCQKNNVHCELQMASEAKAGFWDDDKLRRLGLYKSGSKHAMDALKHCMQYLTFTLNDQYYIYKLKPEKL